MLIQFIKNPNQDEQGRITLEELDSGKKSRSVIARFDGRVKPIAVETQETLDNKIIGNSELKDDGSMIFTSINEKGDFMACQLS